MTNAGKSNRLTTLPKLLLILPVLLVLVRPVWSEAKALTVAEFKQLVLENPMRFDDYKTTNVWTGKRHPPILNSHSKRLFRTVLRDAAKDGPNFDGKYVVASWGCGTECQQFAIINLETGAVTDGFSSNYGQAYRVNSNLLIVNDPSRMFKYLKDDEVIRSWWYTAYYRWDGNTLVLIKSIGRYVPFE
jgi:hypothetical protein